MPLLALLFHSFLVATLAAALFTAPFRAAAQARTPAPGASPAAATAPPPGSAASEAPASEEDQEKTFLHAPIVQSVARVLHLSVDTTVDILLGINFAIIFLLVAIPLGRLMPRIVRKRSQTLSDSLQTARQATTDSQARLNAVEAKLAGLDEEMQKLRAQVEQESLEDEKRIKAALGEESARIVASAEQEIGVAAAQARRGLRNFAADLAIEQAAKQVTLTLETDRALIAEFIAGVAPDGKGKEGAS
jgi:F-type H+-transporting ATPase subunit b